VAIIAAKVGDLIDPKKTGIATNCQREKAVRPKKYFVVRN
jgi:hypothetical protein